MHRRNDAVPTPPPATGIGLRAPHVAEIMASRPAVGFLEVHAENYMGGGPALEDLLRLRHDYPISLHGVGLSLGSADGLDPNHLGRLRRLAAEVRPRFVSEHLSWSRIDGVYLNDLVPLPYTRQTLALVGRHVMQTQDALGRRLLIENPSGYLRYRHSTMPEADFLAELVYRTGCGLLCDVNNIVVTCHNLRLDPHAYLRALPAGVIGEIHLAGHARNDADGATILIDDHGSAVPDPVWALYLEALRLFGAVPALIEWDSDLPCLSVLVRQAHAADGLARFAGRARSNEGALDADAA